MIKVTVKQEGCDEPKVLHGRDVGADVLFRVDYEDAENVLCLPYELDSERFCLVVFMASVDGLAVYLRPGDDEYINNILDSRATPLTPAEVVNLRNKGA